MYKMNIFKIFYSVLMLLIAPLMTLMLHSMYYNKSLMIEWTMFSMNSTQFTLTLIMDWISMSFLSTVMLISASIMKYSNYYMKNEKNISRFLYTLFMFVLSMCALITTPNMFSMLLGWDGLGLTSYILVIFYQNNSSLNAGTITILSNRIGDVSIIMSIALSSYEGSWNFFSLQKMDFLPLFMIMLASCTKSAQIPFSAWLPAAMAAPTPVSSLVHSSTLVTAGIYLMIRFSVMIDNQPLLTKILLMTASATTLMPALAAMLEMDMKKIVALSTLSQLGLMMLSISLKQPQLAFFHLLVHAMFKSTLFLCTGFTIHNIKSSQDTRFVSNMVSSSPLMMTMFILTNMSLSGFPFMAAFYSKDLILELSNSFSMNSVALIVTTIASSITMAYSLRIMYISSSSAKMTYTLTNMSDLSKLLLSSLLPLFITTVVASYMFMNLANNNMLTSPLFNNQKFMLMIMCLFSIILTLMLMKMNKHMVMNLSYPLTLMWFLPMLSSKPLTLMTMMKSNTNFKTLDHGWLEMYGPTSLTTKINKIYLYTQMSQNNKLISVYMISFTLIILTIIM